MCESLVGSSAFIDRLFSLSVAALPDILSACKDIVVIAVAVLGLRAWKQQLKGKTEYDLARRLLKAVYRTRDAMKAFRSPLMCGDEVAQAMKDAGLDPQKGEEVPDWKQVGLAYESRWKPVSEALSDLRVEAVEAEVIWGPKARESLKPLRGCAGELNYAATRYLQFERGSRRPANDEDSRGVDDIAFMRSEDPEKDPFTGKISDAVKKSEAFLRPKLKP